MTTKKQKSHGSRKNRKNGNARHAYDSCKSHRAHKSRPPGGTGGPQGEGGPGPTPSAWPPPGASIYPTDPPWGYRNGEGDGPRTSSPARDMTQVHLERVIKILIDLTQGFLSRRSRRMPLWLVLRRIVETSPLVAAAIEADRLEKAWEAERRSPRVDDAATS